MKMPSKNEVIMCNECYSNDSRITPLLNAVDCLSKHTQYICGTCGRCICIEKDNKRSLQRWNFPFKTLEIAKLYLRTADFMNKQACGIYEINDNNGRISYKIFPSEDELFEYLDKNKNKRCKNLEPVFCSLEYKEYSKTEIRKLSQSELQTYLSER